PRDFDVGSRLVFLRKLISQLGGATRRERNHLIGEVSVMICLLRVAESAQGLDDSVLRFGLARIDDVVNFSDIAEMGMIKCPNCGCNTALVPVGIFVELALSEVAAL